MDIRHVAAIDTEVQDFLDNYPFDFPLEVGLGTIDYEDIDAAYKEKVINVTAEYLDRINVWSFAKNQLYYPMVLEGLKRIRMYALNEAESIYSYMLIHLPDFLVNLPGHLIVEYKNIIDVNTGYPIPDRDEYLKDNFNPRYRPFIDIVQKVHGLIVLKINHIINDIESEKTNENLIGYNEGKTQFEDFGISKVEVNDNVKDHPINYKVHLLHKLGLLEPLKKYYKEKNPSSKNDHFASLLREVLDKTANVYTIKRAVTAALNNEIIESRALKEKLSNTLKKHNLE